MGSYPNAGISPRFLGNGVRKMTNENQTVLDVVIDHYANNRIRYADVSTMTIPDDLDEQNYLLQDMVRAALLARIKQAGHVDVPIDNGRILLEYGQWFEIDHFPVAADLKRIIPALCRKETLTGLISLIKHQGEQKWIVYPEELLHVVDVDYIKSSVGALALIHAAHREYWLSDGNIQSYHYLLDQGVELLVRLWVREHNVKPATYAKWRVQGKQAVKFAIQQRIEVGAYGWE